MKMKNCGICFVNDFRSVPGGHTIIFNFQFLIFNFVSATVPNVYFLFPAGIFMPRFGYNDSESATMVPGALVKADRTSTEIP